MRRRKSVTTPQREVKVWIVRAGAEPTDGEPAYRLSLEACVAKIGLQRRQRFAELGRMPRIGDPGSAAYRDHRRRYVVCKIDESTAAASGWNSGFYLLDLSAKKVAERLS